jgi:cyanate lyase
MVIIHNRQPIWVSKGNLADRVLNRKKKRSMLLLPLYRNMILKSIYLTLTYQEHHQINNKQAADCRVRYNLKTKHILVTRNKWKLLSK